MEPYAKPKERKVGAQRPKITTCQSLSKHERAENGRPKSKQLLVSDWRSKKQLVDI